MLLFDIQRRTSGAHVNPAFESKSEKGAHVNPNFSTRRGSDVEMDDADREDKVRVTRIE